MSSLYILYKKPSLRGLFTFISLILVCILPVALFRIGYKFTFVSKELVLLVILNLLFVGFSFSRIKDIKLSCLQVLLLVATFPIFLFNGSGHPLAILTLYLILVLLLPIMFSVDNIFILVAWSAMIATIVSFYQYWSTAYGVVPGWLELSRHTSRLAGVFGQPNLFACLIVVGLFSWLQVLWQKFGFKGWSWFYQLPVVLFFWALLLTGSKAGLLAFVSALLLLGWGLVRAYEFRLLRFFITQFLWSISLAIILFLLIQPPDMQIIQNRTIDFTEQSASTGTRLIYYGSALAMGSEHLLTGVGLGGYRRLLGSYMVAVAERLHIPYDSISDTLWAHNDFFQVFAECGLFVTLFLLIIILVVLFKSAPTNNMRALFCYCAIWSFFIFMQFGHPFNDHVLVFYFVFLTAGAQQLASNQFELQIAKKIILILLVPAIFFVNFYVISNATNMYYLNRYKNSVAASFPLNVDKLTSLDKKFNYHGLTGDPLVGWEFQYAHLQALSNYAIKYADATLAEYLIPQFEKFQFEHKSSNLNYLLARLYFLVGKYSAGKKTAELAFALNPSMFHYSNFGHICLVFDISRREKKSVSQLLGEKYFLELKLNKVIREDMLDENSCAL